MAESDEIESIKSQLLSVQQSVEFASRISDLRSRVELDSDKTSQRLDAISDKVDDLKRFEELRHEVRLELSRFRWIAAALGVALAAFGSVAGILGFKSINDYITAVKSEVNKRVDDASAFVTDYTRALSLAQGSPDLALPLFRRCHLKSPWDEGVLIGLLAAMDNTLDLADASSVVQKAHADKAKFETLASATTYNNFAAVEIDLGLSDPNVLDVARDDLGRALRKSRVDDADGLGRIYFNYWRLYISKRDFVQATTWNKRLMEVAGADYESWDHLLKNSDFLRTLFSKDPGLQIPAQKSWGKR